MKESDYQGQKNDHDRFFIPQGDPGFSPERNQSIVDEVIRDTEKRQREKAEKYTEGLRERIHAIASFLKNTRRSPDIAKYLGEHNLKHLQSRKFDQIVQKDGSYRLIAED